MSPGDAGLSEALRSDIEAELGPLTRVQALPPGAQGQVWRAHAQGQNLLIKYPSSVAAHRRELWAHRVLDASLGAAIVPLICASDRLLVYPWLASRPVSELEEGSGEELEAYRAAGLVLASMRALDCDADEEPGEIPLSEALPKRFEGALGRAKGLLGELELSRVRERWSAVAWSEELRRSYAHRDYESSNWLVDQEGTLAVIDFGQSRPDYWLWDLVKLEADAFVACPSRRDAFLDGLGGALSSREADQLEALVSLHGLQTLGWAVEHGDEALEALARRILTAG